MAVPRIATVWPDDEFIRQQPISERLKRRFLDEFLEERRRTRTMEQLFEVAGAFRQENVPAPPDIDAFGFNSIVFKGSFVEGVDMILVSAQHFAIVLEEFLLREFERQLRSEARGREGVPTEPDLEATLRSLDGMTAEHRARGYGTTLYVLAGQIEQQLYEDLQRSVQNPWAWYRQLGITRRATHRFVGVHDGIPILSIADSPAPTLYAVDVARFATLTRYGKGPDFEPEFDVRPFSDEEARRVLARQPKLILDPPPESGLEDERVRQLQLRVSLELWETYELHVKDPGAVLARPFAEPFYD